MSQPIIQKSIEVATQPGNAGAVGITTIIAGVSTYAEALAPLAGVLATALGSILTILLIVNAMNKGRDDRKMRRLEREEKHLEIEALKKKNQG